MTFSIILVIVFWGVWGLIEKLALSYGSPWQTLFIFLLWTAVLFLPFGVLMLWKNQGRAGFKIKKWVWFWILVAVFSDLVAILALRFALLGGSTGIVMATTAVYPLITVILSVIFLNEKLSRRQYRGIMFVCLGLFLLSL